jgi:hypothetical protein
MRDSAPPAVVSWERITWAIEQGLQPVEIDRLRRFGCIPGRLMPATYTRLFRALALWKLNDDERDRRIDSWRCGTGQPAPAATKRKVGSVSKRQPPPKASVLGSGSKGGASSSGRDGKPTPASKPSASRSTRGSAGASGGGKGGVPSTSAGGGGASGTATSARGSASARAASTSVSGSGVQVAPPVARPPAPVRGASAAGVDTTVSLSVLSMVAPLPVTVNRLRLGTSPVSLRVPRGRLVTVTVGEGVQRRDTSLYVTGRHDLVVTIESGGSIAAGGGAVPVASASALTAVSVEAELGAVLPPLPREPVFPTAQTPRGARTDVYWSLTAAGIASLASSGHCRRQATSPEPYGGTYTGTYHPPGTFVPSAFLLCGTAIGVTVGAASFPVFRLVSRFVNDGARRRYVADSVSYPQRVRAFAQIRQQRQVLVDSALRDRRRVGGAGSLRWRVDTLPRRLP